MNELLKEALDALGAMLTEFGMDEDSWSKPTFDQARAAHASLTAALAAPLASVEAQSRLSDDQIIAIAKTWAKEPGWLEFERNDFIACIRQCFEVAADGSANHG